MTLTKDIAAKFAVAFVAVAMIFSAFTAPAQAQDSVEDLQALINSLMAQISDLEGDMGGDSMDSMSSASSVCPYTWTRDLSQGSTGADVMKLQQFLNDNPDTRVAVSGAGSAGMETSYYGPATAAAVSKMQVMYRAEVLTPGGLVNPTGYFGPSSRAKANSLCTAAPVSGGDDMGGDDMMDEDEDMMDEDEDNGPVSLQGEGTLSMFETDEEESEVSEGAEDEVVATITVEAEDGDIELTRMTVDLIDASRVGGDANEESDPWDVFDEFSVWVDGDMIGSFDASDEDEYTDEDGPSYSFRFTDLDLVVEEDEEVDMYFAVSVANSVDGSDTANTADWAFHVSSVRYFDADGVATNESAFDELDNEIADDILDATDVTAESGVFAFDIEEAGTDDRADIESSSDNPDAATLKVDDDTSDSDDYTVFVFDIEVDRDSSDLEVGDAFLEVVLEDADGVAVTDVDDIIADITMTIDGTSERGDERTHTTAGAFSTTTYEFEFDQNVELESDEEYEVTVEISFVGTDEGDNYAPGTTVQVFVDGTEWEVEGVENDDELEGSDESEIHTLNTVVPVISGVSVTESDNDGNSQETVTFRFTVEADGEDDIVGFSVANSIIDEISGEGSLDPTPTLVRTGGDATRTGTGPNVFTIQDGDSASFALTYTFTNTAAAGEAGTYFVNLDRVIGVEVDVTSDGVTIAD